MMRFSMILASRERVELLRGLLESLVETTSKIQEIEVLVVIDDDDIETRKQAGEITKQFPFVKFFSRPRSVWMHRDYINWVCPNSTGKYIIVLNDDTKFVVKNWDDLGWDKLEYYLSDKPDGVVYGFTDNMTHDARLCCFPLFSRKAVDAVGFILPNERKNWAADHDAYAIYTHPLVNRKLDLPEIKIEHVAYHAGLRERDAISYRIEQIFVKEPYIDMPITAYADRIARYISNVKSNNQNNSNLNKLKQNLNRKVLVVYNICGISGRENIAHYLAALNSIIYQKFDSFSIAISSCLSSERVRKVLTDNLGDKVNYNWINEKLPLNVTFNHTVQKCVQELGPFESYLYIDSGVTFGSNRHILETMYDLMKTNDYAMVSTQVDSDSGFDYWGIKLNPNQDYVMPVGKTCNLHCQLFSHSIYENYNSKILPDIFAHHTSESVFTFINAAINKKWAISHKVKVHHESNMDGASSGFLHKHSLLFKSPKSIEQICNEGHRYGFGYEECRRICVHDPRKYSQEGFALDPNLKKFIQDNLYLNKTNFDYAAIQHHFINEVIEKPLLDIPSPKITCVLLSHNKPDYVKEAIKSVLNQSMKDWELLIIDSGELYTSGFFNYLDDPRIKVMFSGETEDIKKNKTITSWCFNECFRSNMIKGFLVCYLHDDDIFYPNAFETYTEHIKNNMHIHAVYGSQDMAVHTSDGIQAITGEQRALVRRGGCVGGPYMEGNVNYLQFCHRKEVLDWFPDKSEYWPEAKQSENNAAELFMDKVGRIIPIYPIDIKVGQCRQTPVSVYKPFAE